MYICLCVCVLVCVVVSCSSLGFCLRMWCLLISKGVCAEAVETLVEASNLYIEMGRVSTAAKFHVEIAEIFEKELELDKAVEAFENAVRYYTNAEQPAWANKARNSLAHLLAKVGKYRHAIIAFEELGNSVLDTPSRFSAREYFFKAGLCQFCHAAAGNQDIQNIRLAIEDYDNKDVTFQDQREYKFLLDLLRAYEDYNLDAFEDAVQEFDNVSRLGDWEMGLLLNVREAISRGPSLT